MNLKTTLLGAFAASSLAYGQGTLVIENKGKIQGTEFTIWIYQQDGTGVTGPAYHATLMFNGARVGGEYPFDRNGRFSTGTEVIIPGTTEGGVTSGLALRVWDTRTGSSFETALYKGSSPIFDNPLGGGLTPAPTLVNLPSFSLHLYPPGGTVPEPSTIALSVAGTAALLFRFRK